MTSKHTDWIIYVIFGEDLAPMKVAAYTSFITQSTMSACATHDSGAQVVAGYTFLPGVPVVDPSEVLSQGELLRDALNQVAGQVLPDLTDHEAKAFAQDGDSLRRQECLTLLSKYSPHSE